jgi:hypothetical protein
MKQKKKTTSSTNKKSRDKVKYPNLDQKYNLKVRQEELYIDYKNRLSEEELRWLNKFNKEYVNASLDTSDLKNNLHHTKKLKKDCHDRNNQRNICLYGEEKKNNNLRYIPDLKENEHPTLDYEDVLIDAIEWNWGKK